MLSKVTTLSPASVQAPCQLPADDAHVLWARVQILPGRVQPLQESELDLGVRLLDGADRNATT